jgi:hypothetical protein
MVWMNWAQQFSALAELDGAEWDALHEQLREAWLADYAAAFVDIAARRGWKDEDAVSWLDSDTARAAYLEASRFDWSPERTAEAEVIGCEKRPRLPD